MQRQCCFCRDCREWWRWSWCVCRSRSVCARVNTLEREIFSLFFFFFCRSPSKRPNCKGENFHIPIKNIEAASSSSPSLLPLPSSHFHAWNRYSVPIKWALSSCVCVCVLSLTLSPLFFVFLGDFLIFGLPITSFGISMWHEFYVANTIVLLVDLLNFDDYVREWGKKKTLSVDR